MVEPVAGKHRGDPLIERLLGSRAPQCYFPCLQWLHEAFQ